MKNCTKCKLSKELTEFQKHSRYKDGYLSWCKTCKLDSQRKHPESNKNWVDKHKDRVKEIKSKYASSNSEKVLDAKRSWRKANSKHQLSLTRKYQASKIKATPAWLTPEHIEEMKMIYKNCPKGSHVDHEVPLQGKNVSGLHVPWNLKAIDAKENLKKSNKY